MDNFVLKFLSFGIMSLENFLIVYSYMITFKFKNKIYFKKTLIIKKYIKF